ncbi:MAG TPA: hypothetical protein VD905_16040 [Flavobacteriales bacterium]|nr:hypothetical protein [Flavobacteriales bacterium]
MAKNQKIIDQIIADLNSGQTKTILEAIVTARQKGDETVVPHIIKLLSSNNDEIAKSAKNTLFDLKDMASVGAILDNFDVLKDATIKNLLLQSLWQSNIQPVNYVGRLTAIAVNGTLEDSIEVFSIITNMIDVQIPDAECMEGVLVINNNIEKVKDVHQKQLLRDIAVFLNEQMEQ